MLFVKALVQVLVRHDKKVDCCSLIDATSKASYSADELAEDL